MVRLVRLWPDDLSVASYFSYSEKLAKLPYGLIDHFKFVIEWPDHLKCASSAPADDSTTARMQTEQVSKKLA